MTRTPSVLFTALLVAAGALVSAGRDALLHLRRPIGGVPFSFTAAKTRPGSSQFVGRGPDSQLVVSPTEAVLTAQGRARERVRIRFCGANPNAALLGAEPEAARVSYVLGRDSRRWRSGLRSYRAVRVENAYPGIDLVYYRGGRELEYDFVVQPGADPGRIALQVEGQQRATVTAEGSLTLPGAEGPIRIGRPVTYQEVDGVRQPVASHFVSVGEQVRVALGPYDRRRPLIIDPTLSFSTFLGGSAEEYALAVATDSQGRTYLAGRTASLDFATVDAEQPAFGGGLSDAFIARLSSDGRTLQTMTYFGGMGDETINDLALDDLGNLYVAGNSNSDDLPLRNPIQRRFGGGTSDAFVAKLNADADRLEYATYLGGGGQDTGEGIAVGPSHTAYLTGKTGSLDFPTTSGAFQRRFGGGSTDAFVARLAEDGQSLRYATYLGDIGEENFGTAAGRIAVDNIGNAYVTGTTTSPRFPTTPRAFQRVLRGGQDAYLTKLGSNGDEVVYSTLLGGGSRDFGGDVAVDAGGSALVTGITDSLTFPVTRNAFQSRFGGGIWDAFVTRFAPSGEDVVCSTYLGGRGDEGATFGTVTDFGAAGFRPNGDLVVAGRTDSFNFPLAGPVQPVRGGFADGFFSRLSSDGERLLESTYLGGGANDVATDLSVDPGGDVRVAGFTASRDFPLVNPVQTSYAGGFTDAWVLRLNEPAPPAPKPQLRLSASELDFGSRRIGQDRTRSFTVRNAGQSGLSVTIGSLTSPFEVIEGGGAFVLGKGRTHRVRVRFTPTTIERNRQLLSIASTDPIRPTVTVTITGRGTAAR